MAVSLTFADSFDHYDSDTDLKWSTGGGTLETDPDHVRTGAQSLRIQAGDSPSLTNFPYPVNVNATVISQPPRFTVGFAWQTSSLAGETIIRLMCNRDTDGQTPLVPPQRQFILVQNADGSISVYTGNGLTPTLIGSTVAGILTVGPFWYLEFSADMIGGTLSLTVTDDLNTATEVLTASGFVTTQPHIDGLEWGGPSGLNSAWIDDFYFADWDTVAPAVMGAPKIYGAVVPSADGVGVRNAVADPTPYNVTSAPYFSQVNEEPQNTGSFIAREDVDGFFPFSLGQGFQFDVSQVPGGATIAAIQAVVMWSFGHDIDGNAPNPDIWAGPTGGTVSDFGHFRQKDGLVDSPFLFLTFAFDTNPQTGDPWTVAEFSGGTAYQIGPGVGSEG